MKCYNCGHVFIEQTGDLSLPSKVLGDFTINNVQHFKCQQCEETMLPDNTWLIADQEESRLIKDFLFDLPLKKFIGSAKVGAILKISKQALHKHRKIKKGFIYSIFHEGRKLYHVDSVHLFKETGDGRFPLGTEIGKNENEYIYATSPESSDHNTVHDYEGMDRVVG